jgi:hypothetical protein
MSDYKRYPPDPPSRRTLWILIAAAAIIPMIGSVVHHLVAMTL